MKRKKLIITGGHLTPALAVMDELQQKESSWELVFVGRKTTMEGQKDISREQEIVSSMGVRFLAITTGRLQRTLSVHSFVSICKIPIGFIQAFLYCVQERPQGILSFGGYVALPVVVAAWILRIPVVTHEQTSVVGVANRIIARFARKICITFEETKGIFPEDKVVHTGLPVRKALLTSNPISPWTLEQEKYPVIYMTGGSTGSVSLNALLFPLVGKLTQRYTVIHQTGRLSLEDGIRTKQVLPADCVKRYIVQDYYGLTQLSWIMRHATLVVGRSGANTVMETAMLGNMALFIPLPWSGGGEQIQNARWLERHGSAKVILQQYANTSNMLEAISEMMKKKRAFQSAAAKLAKRTSRNGAANVVREVEACVQ